MCLDWEPVVELAQEVEVVERTWVIWNLDAERNRSRFRYARWLSYTYVCVSKSALKVIRTWVYEPAGFHACSSSVSSRDE